MAIRLWRRPTVNVGKLRQDTLDDFVTSIDRQGGPGMIDRSDWAGVYYTPTFKVNQSLDPYSSEYCDQQIELYKEISGRQLDQYTNELLDFDVARHANQRNAFGVGNPSQLSLHYSRLAKLIRYAKLSSNAKVLDMGCGWGVSSEFFATLGCQVTAVDINAKFVELVNLRSQRFDYGINAIRGGFEEVTLPERYELIVFYECLHHAVRPWTVVEKMASELAPNGSIGFAGEPIQSLWWKHWGMRLDPLSIYCIRKHGWFESGWSKPFIIDVMNKSGLIVEYVDDVDPHIGPIAIGTNKSIVNATLKSADIARFYADDKWMLNGDYLVSTGNNSLVLNYPGNIKNVRFNISSFRNQKTNLKIVGEQNVPVYECVLHPGSNVIDLKYTGATKYNFISDVWTPKKELGSADDREMSFHLTSIEFFSGP